MELIRKSDALHAVLHNTGDAAVAAIENIKPINPHGELREMLIDEMIDKGEWQGIIIDGQYWAITCSNCHQVGFNAKTPYCPNCGAKMKGANDGET